MTVVIPNRTNDLVHTVQVRERDGNDTTVIRSYYKNETGTFFWPLLYALLGGLSYMLAFGPRL